MRVVDTSAWIEWIVDSPLSATLAAELPDTDSWVVPTIVLFELAKWAHRAPISAEAARLVVFAASCVVIPLDERTALEAARIGQVHRLATADAIIYATAVAVGADLLTCDAHFKGLPNVAYFEKRLH